MKFVSYTSSSKLFIWANDNPNIPGWVNISQYEQ